MDTEKLIIPSMTGGNNDGGLLGGGGLGALLIGALLFGGGMGGFGGGKGGYGNGNGGWSEAAKNDVVLNPAFQSLQNQIQTLSAQAASNALDSSISDVERSVSNSSATVSGQIANLSTAQASQNFTTLQSINALGRDVSAQANQNALQQLNSFNILSNITQQGFNTSNIATLTGFNNLAMQQVTATNQIIAQGTALSTQVANCCCEIKEKIGVDGDLTRALINSINLSNIQGQLNDAKNQISNFQQTQTILNSLSPRPAVSSSII